MKIIYNNIIPFKGFRCINLFCILFARNGCSINEEVLNHEGIHTVQIIEMFVIGFVTLLPFVVFGLISPWWLFASVGTFYYWYFIEWLVRIFKKGNAYRNISFEREAFDNDDDLTYLANRKRYAWWKYL